MLREFVEKVLEEREGYRLERPWIPEGVLLAVVPILRETNEERRYYTLPEVSDRVELKDTGYISGVSVGGGGIDKPVLILASEILEGQGTQSRGVVHSTVVMPNTVKTLETRCVHRSHPIKTEATFRPVGLAPARVAKYLVGGPQWSSQSNVWSAITSYSLSASTYSGLVGSSGGGESVSAVLEHTDSLPKLMKQTTELLSDILSKIPCFENQVGAIIVGVEGVKGMETFNHPDSWEARYRDVMGKHADEVKRTKLFKMDVEECMKVVREFLERLKSAETTVIEQSGDYSVCRLKVDGYVGEAVFLYGELVYMFVVQHEEGDDKRDDRRAEVVVGAPVTITYPDMTVRPYDVITENRSTTTSTVNLRSRIGWNEVVSVLSTNADGMTWTELQKSTGLNPSTLTNRLKEGVSAGVIKRDIRRDGRPVYRLVSGYEMDGQYW